MLAVTHDADLVGQGPARIKFLQTADAIKYARMLAVSAPSTRAFCAAHGFAYEAFVGLKHGWHPWHATYNRIAMLNEALDAGFEGWLVYLDADAFVVDLHFDLPGYLRGFADKAMIVRPSVPGQQMTWRINAGVLVFNTHHRVAVDIIRWWGRLFRASRLAGQLALPPHLSLVDDQKLLQGLLWSRAAMRRHVHYEDPALINSGHASFIAQYLLSDVPDFDLRVAMIAAKVASVFEAANVVQPCLSSGMAEEEGVSGRVVPRGACSP